MSSPSSYDIIFPEDEKTPSPSPPPPKDELIIDDFAYSLEDLVGNGHFALVYKGRRISDNQVAAIKIIDKSNFALVKRETRSEIVNTEELMQLIHPNIVTLYGALETDDQFHLFMEYCNHKDLASYLVKLGTLSERTIKFYLRQIAEAIKYMHDRGMIHRDLNPDNILLHSDEEDPEPLEMTVKISNFAVTRSIEDGGGAMAMSMVGSALFGAPEIFLSLPYNGKADIWSIGTIGYTCFAGGPPMRFQTADVLMDVYHGRRELSFPRPLGSSDNFWNLLVGLLRPNPEQRMTIDDVLDHSFIRNTRSLPIPRPKRDSKSSDYSYNSCDQFSPVFSNMPDDLEERKSPERCIHEGGTPKALEGAKYADDSTDDIEFDDFVLVPITDSATGLVIDPYFDPVHEVILPCVRKPKSPVAGSSKRKS